MLFFAQLAEHPNVEVAILRLGGRRFISDCSEFNIINH